MPNLDHWCATWRELGAAQCDEDLFHDLAARYREPHRKYHTLQHLAECFGRFDQVRAQAAHPAEIQLALWFHDAVYDVKRQDNEKKSAAWARSAILNTGLETVIADRVYALILTTRHEAKTESADAKILIDVDLSILGAAPARFDEYERQVREEYGWVPDPVFRHARRKILQEFLARPSLFNTRHFQETLESQARINLERVVKV